ncbi:MULTISPECIES: hypothetical protein [Arthrobacter]|uniref:Uncharacterized protein n=1 Tax=Arthrobacter terricola TaxID=2547396 RepID=A0A4R5KK75_9MICC|nr:MULTISPECIES: hypothetical protein [Arthrobacter]MBT8161570.1 hypothetical protein [Arthrobacter sp. GN70]TDF95238.1 hypothetical protein E1809_12020 [Arthrobacter terricola]
MKWFLRISAALTSSFVLTMIVVVGSFIMTMFSAREVGVRKFGLFGAVFFHPQEQSDGSTILEAGVSNGAPIAIIFVLLAAFQVAVASVLERLKAHKRRLQEAD